MGTPKWSRKLFGSDSPMQRYEIEKLYLSNNKLIQYEPITPLTKAKMPQINTYGVNAFLVMGVIYAGVSYFVNS